MQEKVITKMQAVMDQQAKKGLSRGQREKVATGEPGEKADNGARVTGARDKERAIELSERKREVELAKTKIAELEVLVSQRPSVALV